MALLSAGDEDFRPVVGFVEGMLVNMGILGFATGLGSILGSCHKKLAAVGGNGHGSFGGVG